MKKAIFKLSTSTQVIEVKEVLTAAELQPAVKAGLVAGICHFAYAKKDGSIRNAFGTLNQAFIPPAPAPEPGKEAKKPRPESPLTQTYYDLEAKEWRAYTIANISALY